MGTLLADLSDVLGTWAYALVPALAFFETAAFLGLLVPGETAVLVGGVVAERVHEQSKIRSGAADFPPLEMTG